MGTLGQIRLLLWKNFILRKRQPVVLFLELVWPVLVLLVVTLVRFSAPPVVHPTCHYAARPLPNAGFTFLTKYICSLQNTCHLTESAAEENRDERMHEFLKALEPFYQTTNKSTGFMDDLPKVEYLMNSFQETLMKQEVQDLIHTKIILGELFRNQSVVKAYVVDVLKVLPGDIVDAILQSSVNLTALYDLVGYRDLRGIVCDSSKLQQYILLPSSDSPSPDAVSNALCHLNASVIPNITSAIQRQLDVSKIVRGLAKLENMLGSATLADGLYDLASLVELFVSSRTMSNLISNMPLVHNATKWALKLVRYVASMQETGPDLHSVNEVLTDVMRLLPSPAVNSTLDQLINGLRKLQQAGNWLSFPTSIQDVKATFGDLISQSMKLYDYVWKSVGLADKELELAMKTPLDLNQVSEFLTRLSTSSSLNETLCYETHFSSLFLPPDAHSARILQDMETSLCQLNASAINRELGKVIDVQNILQQARDLTSHQLDKNLAAFNWTDFVNSDLLTRLNFLSSVIHRFGPLLRGGHFSIRSILGNIGQMVTAFREPSLDMIDSVVTRWLGSMQGMLDEQSEMQRFVMALDQLIDFCNSVMDENHVIRDKLYALLKTNADLRDLIAALVNSHTETTRNIMKFQFDPAKEQSRREFAQSLHVKRLLCNTSWLREDLGVQPVDLSRLHEPLCRGNVAYNLQQLMTDTVKVDSLYSSSMDDMRQTLMENVPVDKKRINVTRLYERMMATQARLQESDFGQMWTKEQLADLRDIMSSEPYDPIGYMGAMATSGFISQMSLRLMETLGVMLEQSPSWSFVEPVVYAMDSYVRQFHGMIDKQKQFSDGKTLSSKLLFYFVKYGPQLMSAFAESDEHKIDKLLSSSDPVGVLCDPVELVDLIQVSSGVPVEEVQATLCNLNVDQLANEWTVPQPHPRSVSGEPYDWQGFLTRINELSEAIPSQFTGQSTTWLSRLFTDINGTAFAIAAEKMSALLQSPTIMQTGNEKFVLAIGRLLEKSSDWNDTSRVIDILQQVLVNMNSQLRTMTDIHLAMTQSSKLLSYFVKYGPQILSAFAELLTDEQKLEDLFSSSELVSRLCDPDELADFINFPNDVPIDDIQTMLCDLNVNDLASEFSPPMQPFRRSDPTEPYDWQRLLELSSELQQILPRYVNALKKPPQFWNGLNVSAYGVAARRMFSAIQSPAAMQALQGMLLEQLVTAVGRQLEKSNAWYTTSEMVDTYQQYVVYLNSQLRTVTEFLGGGTDFGKLLSYFNKYGPQIVMAFADMLSDEQKIETLLLSPNPVDLLCDPSDLADLLTFSSDVPVDEIQAMLCDIDVNELVSEWPIAMKPFPRSNPTEPYDWRALVKRGSNLTQTIQSYVNAVTNPDVISGMNTTAFNMAAHRLLSALQGPVGAKLLRKLSAMDSPLLDKLLTTFDSQPWWQVTEMYRHYISAVLTVIYNDFDRIGTEGQSLLDFIGSTQLEKMITAIEKSPEIVSVLMKGLAEAAKNPMEYSDVTSMCEDAAEFNKLFEPPEGSAVSRAYVYELICEQLNLNISVFVRQLMSHPSVTDVFKLLETPADTSMIALVKKMRAIIERITNRIGAGQPVNTGVGSVWMNTTRWSKVFNDTIDQWRHAMEHHQPNDTIQDAIVDNLESLLTMIGTAEQRQVYLTSIDKMLSMLEAMAEFQNPTEMFRDSPEILKLLTTLQKAPDILAAMVLTPLDKIKAPYFELRDFDSFCAGNVTAQFTLLDEHSDLDSLQGNICSLNFTLIQHEVYILLAEFSKTFTHINSQEKVDSSVSVSTLANRMTKVFQRWQSALTTTTELADWMDTQRWMKVIQVIRTKLSMIDVTQQNSAYGALLRTLSQWFDLSMIYQYMDASNAATQLIIDKLSAMEKVGHYNITALFPKSPEIQKFLALLDKTPALVEVLVYSMNTDKFASFSHHLPSICSEPSSLHWYLTVPADVSVDLDSVQKQICKLNMTAMLIEWTQEPGWSAVCTKLTEKPSSMNWTAVFLRATMLNIRMTELVSTMSKTTTQPGWMNVTTWRNIVYRFNNMTRPYSTSNMYESILKRMSLSMESLEGIKADPLTTKMMQAMNMLQIAISKQLDLVNSSQNGTNVTVDSLLLDVGLLRTSLNEKFGLADNVIDTLLHTRLSQSNVAHFFRVTPVEFSHWLCSNASALNGSRWKHSVCATNAAGVFTEIKRHLVAERIMQQVSTFWDQLPANASLQNSSSFAQSISDMIKLASRLTNVNASGLAAIARLFDPSHWLPTINHFVEKQATQQLMDWLKHSRYLWQPLNKLIEPISHRFAAINDGNMTYADVFTNSTAIMKLYSEIVHDYMNTMRQNQSSETSWSRLNENLLTLQTLLTQLMNFDGRFADSKKTTWVDRLVASMTNADDNQINTYYCTVATSVIDSGIFRGYLKAIMIQLQQGYETNVKMLATWPDIENLICELPHLNFSQIYHRILKMPAMEVFVQNNTIRDFDCDRMSKANSEMFSLIKSMASSWGKSKLTSQCLDGAYRALLQGATQLDTLLDVFREGVDLLTKIPDVHSIQFMSELLPLLMKSLNEQRPVWMEVAAVVHNTTDLRHRLSHIANLSTPIINRLLQSTVNVNLMKLANLSDADISRMLCDPATRSEIFTSPDNITVPSLLCDAHVNQTVREIRQAIDSGLVFLQLTRQASNYPIDAAWLRSLINDLGILTSHIDQLANMSSLFQNFDSRQLVQSLPDIQRLLSDHGPQKIIESFLSIINRVSEQDNLPQPISVVLQDLRTLLEGVRSLKVLAAYFPDVRMRSVLKSPPKMKSYMTTKLNLSDEVADAILNATISLKKVFSFVSLSGVQSVVCDEARLRTAISLPRRASAALWNNVSASLCSLNREEAVNVTDFLLQELDIGSFVMDFLNLSPDKLLRGANMSQDEAHEMFDRLNSVSDQVRELAESYQRLGLQPVSSALTDSYKGKTSTMLRSLSRAVCGKDSAFDIDNTYNLNIDNDNEDDEVEKGDKNPSSTDQIQYSDDQKAEMAEFEDGFCADFYRDLQKTANGRIVWSFLKPLMRGKLLYTPDTPATRAILKDLDDLFRSVQTMKDFALEWSKTLESAKELNNMTGFIDTLESSLSNPFLTGILRNAFNIRGEDLVTQLHSFANMTPDTISELQSIADVAINAAGCFDTDRMLGFADEHELEKEAFKLAKSKNVLAAVVFTNVAESRSRRDVGEVDKMKLAKHVTYKIRMDIDHVPSTSRNQALFWRPGAEDNFADDLRYLHGFSQLQDLIERAIIRLQSGQRPLVQVDSKQFPYPCYKEDTFQLFVGMYFFPIMMVLAWMVVVGNSIRNLVYDKEHRIDETLKVMGLRPWISWITWFINALLGMLVMSVVIVLFLKYGRLMPHADPALVFVFLAVFSVATLSFCYLVSVFFHRASIAALVGIMTYVISYLPFVIIVSVPGNVLFWHQAISSLSLTTAFSYGAQIMSYNEQTGSGSTWQNINEPYVYDFTFAWCIYMMLIDSAIYLILAWYIRNVFPGKYGIARPWYFPCTASYWGCHGSSSNTGLQNTAAVETRGEPDPRGLPVGLSIRGLRKVYKNGKKDAVKGISFNCYEGQVTALLGQNGAGKTTIMNLLTGLYSPTSGSVLVNGRDMQTRKASICKDLGVCPQSDVLFESLTVQEHLQFFASLKGNMSRKKQRAEMNRLLDLTELHSELHVPASHLSGGQRRRLCVAMAFAGNARVVLLDEPTSGVDPAVRRHVWDLIVRERHGRTIIMTTHHLDEADVLGDRLAIIHQGNLVCVGSPMYMKKKFGDGYHMTVAKEISANVHGPEQDVSTVYKSHCSGSELLSLLQSHVPGAELTDEVGGEVRFMLPTTAPDWPDRFRALFIELDANRQSLGIDSYGLSDTTLEEAFLKIVKAVDSSKAEVTRRTDITTRDEIPETELLVTAPSAVELLSGHRRHTGVSLAFRQMAALLVKRLHHNRRDFRSFLSQIVMPALFVCLAMVCMLIRPAVTDLPSLKISTDIYVHETAMFYRMEDWNERNSKLIQTTFGKSGVGTDCMPDNTDNAACTIGNTAKGRYLSQPGPCSCEDEKYVCTEAPSEDLLKMRSTPTGQKLVNLTDVPLSLAEYLVRTQRENIENRYGGWSFKTSDAGDAKATVWYNNKGWHSLPAYHNALNNMILRASVNSSAEEYGITLYNHPLNLNKEQLSKSTFVAKIADIGIALMILCAFCFVPAGFVLYLINERIQKERTQQAICGVGSAIYWGTALFWDMLSCVLTVALVTAVMAAFNLSSYTANLNLPAGVVSLLLFCWASVPLMYLFVRCFSEPSLGYMVLFLSNLIIGIATTSCVFLLQLFQSSQTVKDAAEIISYIFLIFPQYCLGNAFIQIVRNQFITDVYAHFDIDVYVNPFSFEMLAWNWIAMAIQGFVFFTLTLMMDIKCRRFSPKKFYKSHKSRFSKGDPHADYKEDDDVSLERQRVMTGEASADLLVLLGLSKVYKSRFHNVQAVRNISAGIPKGECFGLLGVNGAGKTTLFNMITGELSPSRGGAIFDGRVLSGDGETMRNNVGYCPQVDALDDYLTGRETLQLYGRLKGMSGDELDMVCNRVLSLLALQQYADKTVKTYSGGTKRKLSTAIALLGDPDLILMDEPTTGMDPNTRRLVWNTITTVVKQKRSIVLTSHSMSECEALCTRISIMVNGQFVCLGSAQRLKHRYGEGYTVTVKMAGDVTMASSRISQLTSAMQASFHGAYLKDQHLNTVELGLPARSLADVFSWLETQKALLSIEDYSVMQTTLDQVFMQFGKHQAKASGNVTSLNGDATAKHIRRSLSSDKYVYDNPALANTSQQLQNITDVNPVITTDIKSDDIQMTHTEDPHEEEEDAMNAVAQVSSDISVPGGDTEPVVVITSPASPSETVTKL